MNDRLSRFIQQFRKDLSLYLAISLGVFLFVLFFQPFPIGHFDFNNGLLFVAGLGVIVFLCMVIFRGMLPRLSRQPQPEPQAPTLAPYLSGFLVLTACSVAFAFYLRYVGSVSISFYVMFKVILICFAPPLALWLYDTFLEQKQKIRSLVKEKKILQIQVEKYEEDYLHTSIEFVSESRSDNLILLLADVVLIRSADNYVEIAFKEGDDFRKQLIRSTLKNLELQLKPYFGFIRCHRTCIVNIHHVEKLNRNYGNYWLSIRGDSEKIPVSRQYLSKLREVL